MTGILQVDSVCQYNEMMGVETLHPLVGVIDLSKCSPRRYVRYSVGFYTIFLKEVKCGDIRYGRSYYDYQEGTLVFLAPGQVIGIEDNGQTYQPKGWALTFHPDLLRGTELGRTIKEYSYFSYEVNEALHLSEQERQTVVECLQNIESELRRTIDKHSRPLIVSNITLLLNYCMRFYERQFVTRNHINRDVLSKFERLLDEYFQSGGPEKNGLPSVRYFADRLCLSSNYFGDLIKRETGRSAQEQIQAHVIGLAKDRLFDLGKSISQIAYELGFQYPQHFSRMFKKAVGKTPLEYRSQG